MPFLELGFSLYPCICEHDPTNCSNLKLCLGLLALLLLLGGFYHSDTLLCMLILSAHQHVLRQHNAVLDIM